MKKCMCSSGARLNFYMWLLIIPSKVTNYGDKNQRVTTVRPSLCLSHAFIVSKWLNVLLIFCQSLGRLQ